MLQAWRLQDTSHDDLRHASAAKRQYVRNTMADIIVGCLYQHPERRFFARAVVKRIKDCLDSLLIGGTGALDMSWWLWKSETLGIADMRCLAKMQGVSTVQRTPHPQPLAVKPQLSVPHVAAQHELYLAAISAERHPRTTAVQHNKSGQFPGTGQTPAQGMRSNATPVMQRWPWNHGKTGDRDIHGSLVRASSMPRYAVRNGATGSGSAMLLHAGTGQLQQNQLADASWITQWPQPQQTQQAHQQQMAACFSVSTEGPAAAQQSASMQDAEMAMDPFGHSPEVLCTSRPVPPGGRFTARMA